VIAPVRIMGMPVARRQKRLSPDRRRFPPRCARHAIQPTVWQWTTPTRCPPVGCCWRL